MIKLNTVVFEIRMILVLWLLEKALDICPQTNDEQKKLAAILHPYLKSMLSSYRTRTNVKHNRPTFNTDQLLPSKIQLDDVDPFLPPHHSFINTGKTKLSWTCEQCGCVEDHVVHKIKQAVLTRTK